MRIGASHLLPGALHCEHPLDASALSLAPSFPFRNFRDEHRFFGNPTSEALLSHYADLYFDHIEPARAQAKLAFQVISERYDYRRSTAVTTNRPFKDWTKVFPDALNAQVIAERLTERSVRFVLDGKGYRPTQQSTRVIRGSRTKLVSAIQSPALAWSNAPFDQTRTREAMGANRRPGPWVPLTPAKMGPSETGGDSERSAPKSRPRINCSILHCYKPVEISGTCINKSGVVIPAAQPGVSGPMEIVLDAEDLSVVPEDLMDRSMLTIHSVQIASAQDLGFVNGLALSMDGVELVTCTKDACAGGGEINLGESMNEDGEVMLGLSVDGELPQQEWTADITVCFEAKTGFSI